jgi:hypothetical protein
MAKNSLRGSIILKWEEEGSPQWIRYDQLLIWATECDSDLESRGFNPSPTFRIHLYNRDYKDLSSYLKGDKFPFIIV